MLKNVLSSTLNANPICNEGFELDGYYIDSTPVSTIDLGNASQYANSSNVIKVDVKFKEIPGNYQMYLKCLQASTTSSLENEKGPIYKYVKFNDKPGNVSVEFYPYLTGPANGKRIKYVIVSQNGTTLSEEESRKFVSINGNRTGVYFDRHVMCSEKIRTIRLYFE
jgi:hypothetical protein